MKKTAERTQYESNIVNMTEYIIIFLHMDWFIAFVHRIACLIAVSMLWPNYYMHVCS